jgi:hypothetical protein
MNALTQFRLTETAKLAVEAAFTNLARNAGSPGWAAGEFASNLTAWLVEERLLPVQVSPEDFKRCIESRATAALADRRTDRAGSVR